MSKTRDDSWAIGAGYSRIHRHRSESGDWWSGTVVTPHGFVEVYSQEGASNYRLVRNGREHMRSENRQRTKRGLAIMARRFMREICEAP
ncbi:MAG: hypothetical protein AMXMBFR53_30150 [Gemmatimonadota bacterium]